VTPPLPPALRSQLVEALARLLVADVEHHPELPAEGVPQVAATRRTVERERGPAR
jgi:hypothetical protein